MPLESNQIKQTSKKLRCLQRKHAKSLKRFSKMLGKVDRVHHKMQAMEALVVEQEQLVHKLLTPINWIGKNPQHAHLIINPNSGSFAEKIQTPENLVDMLRSHGIMAQVYLKTSGKELRQYVRAAAKKKGELIIAVGGDGTIENVALSLLGSQSTLGIIPSGTMNNLARGLGIPLDIEQACALLGTGVTRQIDVGCIYTKGSAHPTYFLETAGLGLAIALPTGQNIKKGEWGKLPENIRKLFSLGAASTLIELDSGEKIETKVKLVTVSNAPLTGLNNLIAPDAKMDDGLFDLAVYDDLSNLEVAKHFLSTANSQRVYNPNVHFYRAHRIKIRSQQELPATSDKNELPSQEELDIKVLPRILKVIVGKGPALNWPVEAARSVPPMTGEQIPSKRDQAEQKDASDAETPLTTLVKPQQSEKSALETPLESEPQK